ncbi:MAG: hypothetical protein U0793_02780 [Gemmataceae bacterium]
MKKRVTAECGPVTVTNSPAPADRLRTGTGDPFCRGRTYRPPDSAAALGLASGLRLWSVDRPLKDAKTDAQEAAFDPPGKGEADRRRHPFMTHEERATERFQVR